MRMADPVPTFSYIVKQLADKHSSLAYIHMIQPRIKGNDDQTPGNEEVRESCV
jgi:NADPH2 dehydrogenase